MHTPTRRQRQVLDIIADHIKSNGYRPSYAYIARRLGLNSRAGIARIVKDLEDHGLLTRRRENGHFNIELGSSGDGPTPAGIVLIDWLEVPENGNRRESWQMRPVLMPEFILGFQTPDRIRAFLVEDDLMADADIHEEDVVLVELRKGVRDGDPVVAILNKERAVLRKYYRVGSRIELRPAGDHDPEDVILLPADQIEIVALYRGLIRPVA